MKLLFENWRIFLNEEKNIKGALDNELDQEGGAAGLDPLVGAAKKVDADATEDEVEDTLDKMKNVKQHEEGDYVDTIELKEEDKIKGADGKECWDGYRYAGTDEDGKDKCVPSGKKKVNEEQSAAWQRKAGKNEEGGLNDEGRKSYEKDNPGSDLKAPVDKKTADKNPEGKAAGRRASFCARMKGMKKKLTSKETASDPDSRINKALKKWDC
jgi:hypothetical protein